MAKVNPGLDRLRLERQRVVSRDPCPEGAVLESLANWTYKFEDDIEVKKMTIKPVDFLSRLQTRSLQIIASTSIIPRFASPCFRFRQVRSSSFLSSSL